MAMRLTPRMIATARSKNLKARRKAYANAMKNQSKPAKYTESQKLNKFGIFAKKGWKQYYLGRTRQECEKQLKLFSKPELYEIREIIEWGDEEE